MGRQVLSIGECEIVARELSLDSKETKAALRFFDRLNILFYKDDPRFLEGVVFTSSQVLLDAVTKLVEKRQSLLEAKKTPSGCCKPTDGIWRQFRDQAKITLKHLKDEIFQPYYVPGIFTEETFLHLLKNLLIVAPINEPSEYFCPALLEMVEVDEFLRRDDMVTRVVHFPGGYVPPGVFCCAVCHLVSSINWKIRQGDVVARNQITFAALGRKVTFTDKLQFLTVSIAEKDVNPGQLAEINNGICKAIDSALKATDKEKTLYGLSFLCPCTDHKALHPATVVQENGDFNFVCTKEDLISGTLDKHQRVWHTSKCLGVESRPSPIDLSNKVLPRVTSKIELLSIQLGLDKHEFDTIEKNNPSDVHSQTLNVLYKWREKDVNYTWEFLIQALRSESVQLPRLARELEDWLRCRH